MENRVHLRTLAGWIDAGFAITLITLGVIGLRIVTTPLWFDWYDDPVAIQPIGEVRSKPAPVRLKMHDSLFWRDIGRRGQPVSAGDTVFTGQAGSAEIRLTEGSEVTLGPNSLIIIEAPKIRDQKLSEALGSALSRLVSGNKKKSILRLDSGSMKLKIKKKQGAVFVKTKTKVLKIASNTDLAEVELVSRTVNGEEEVQVGTQKSSQVSVKVLSKKDKKTHLLKGENTLVISKNEATQTSIKIENIQKRQNAPAVTIRGPSNQSKVVVDQDNKQVLLSWDTIRPPFRPEVEIKSTEKGLVTKHKESANPRGINLELDPGTYLWRMRANSPNGSPSDWTLWKHFEVTYNASSAEEAKPKEQVAPLKEAALAAPLKPAQAKRDKAKAQASPKKVEVLPTLEAVAGAGQTRAKDFQHLDQVEAVLHWRPIASAKNYTVTVTSGGDLLYSDTTEEAKFNITLKQKNIANSAYQIKALLKSGQSIQSDWIPIKIFLSPPRPAEPKNRSIHEKGSNILLTWEKTSVTDFYQVQISRDPKFKKGVKSLQSKQNLQFYRPSRAGTYYWRIKGQTQKRQSPWSSPARVFTVE